MSIPSTASTATSTAATYLIAATNGIRICFYLEKESQPDLAAYYFWRMHEEKVGRLVLPGDFCVLFILRDLPRALKSIRTRISAIHWMSNGHICASHRTMSAETTKNTQDAEKWEVFYQGPWHQFVNHYLELKPLHWLYLFQLEANAQEANAGANVMNLLEVQNLIEKKLIAAERSLDQNAVKTANALGKEGACLRKQRDEILKKYGLSLDEIIETNFNVLQF